jgi:hypothetical protein
MVVDPASRSFPFCCQSQPFAQSISAHQLDPGRRQRAPASKRAGSNRGWVSLARHRQGPDPIRRDAIHRMVAHCRSGSGEFEYRLVAPRICRGLWVGTHSGLSRVDRDRVIPYPALGKLPCPVIVSILEDPSRGLWLLNACPAVYTLALLSPDGSLQTFGIRDGLPDQPLRALFHDAQGELLIITTSGGVPLVTGAHGGVLQSSYAQSCGDRRNRQRPITDGGREKGPDISLFQRAGGLRRPAYSGCEFSKAMLYDRDGNIWIGTMGQGLLRIRKTEWTDSRERKDFRATPSLLWWKIRKATFGSQPRAVSIAFAILNCSSIPP